ncbi:MAG: hypothetical protein JXA92_00495 [candidate division Zixibacteria bacterium]|nr:hypothetical protein [candidate division Zixibacteria bacterium]
MKKRISLTRRESSAGNNPREDSYEEVDINLIEMLRAVLRRKRLFFITVVSVMVITAGVMLVVPNTYRSTASILPTGNSDKMAELKRIAGLGSLVSNDENASTLYPVILKSRMIMDAVLNKKYTFSHGDDRLTLTLPDYFDSQNPDNLYSGLTGITSFGINKKTGVIELVVETRYPAFSQALLSAYLAELENFNIHKRRSRAKDNVKYLSRQLEEKEAELDEARNKLAEFQLQNQNWAGSTNPEIIKVLSRLQMDIEVKSQSYVYITQEYEMARREVQNDIPIVRILDTPSLPTKKAGPRRMFTVLLMGILAFSVTLFFVLVSELLRIRSQEPGGEIYRELRDDVIRAVPVVNRLLERRKNKSEAEKTSETFYV